MGASVSLRLSSSTQNGIEPCEYADLNRTSIRAQIEVLEKRMAEDAVATAYGDSDSPDYVPYVYDSALTACHWMIGKSKNRPNDDWSGLL